MTIGETIRHIRQLHGMSQKELADICGVSMGAVSAWEQGRNDPRPRALNKIAKYFNIPVNTLLHSQDVDQLYIEREFREPGTEHSPQEEKLLRQYRQLSKLGKETVDAVIDVQLKGQQEAYPTAAEETVGVFNEPHKLYAQMKTVSPEIRQELERYLHYLLAKEASENHDEDQKDKSE